MAVAAWHRKRAVAAFLLILVAEDADKLTRQRKQNAANKAMDSATRRTRCLSPT